jgi:hypothetical protein
MDEIICAFCGIEMKNTAVAYGLTRGAIVESCGGFKIDEDSEWDIYCPDCMNAIDKLTADYKRTLKQ